MYKTIQITKNIILLRFKSKKEITSTMLRFQEYYESPEFKNKIFTLNEFKIWYTKNSPNGKKTNKFTYYNDWSGFNIPDYCFDPFINGDFNPLTKKEQKILKTISSLKKPFYIIAVYKDDSLLHEVKHGLFHVNSDYKNEVLKVLNKYKLKKQRKKIQELGYHEDVLNDELHAYTEILPILLQEKLIKIYRKYIKIEG